MGHSKIFSNLYTDEGFVSRIYKGLSKLNNKKNEKTRFKSGKAYDNRHFKKIRRQ